MASLIKGFENDIFISYRQKDNKGDRWVSEFVEALKNELESTFKEEISIYFDINPHDGLLETHDVDASLKEKLKCLVFIPVISQTYCDPKSYAWEHEFRAFIDQASRDQFGMKVKLPNGNVANRILPIQIHDLDTADKALIENELGGVLRSIEFIYKSAGVNRPLRANEDHPQDNLNKTYYRDQINKVANAVKEIISALKNPNKKDEINPEKIIHRNPEKQKQLKIKFIIAAIIFSILLISGYFIFRNLPLISKQPEKTIAVLPFKNISNDTTQVYFCDGFMEELNNNLQRVGEYTVRPRTSTDRYRKTTKTSNIIGNEINVNYLITGSIGMEDNILKIWVQLIDTKTNKTIWTNDYKREKLQLFELQSEIAKKIAVELKTVLSPEEIIQIDKKPTENLEAYNYYLRGNDYYWRSLEKQNFEIAAKMYEKAIESDPEFAMAYVRLSLSYLSLHWFYYDQSTDQLSKGKEAIDRAFKIDPNLPQAHLAMGYYYYWGFLNYSKALEEIEIAEYSLENNSECIYTKAVIYRRAGEWSLAKENLLKAFELDPGSPRVAQDLALTFYISGEYQEAEKYFRKALLLNPTFDEAIFYECLMYMKWQGNTRQAREAIAEVFQFNESVSNPWIIELNVLMDIYDGNYQKTLSYLSSKDIDVIEIQRYYINLKSLLYARIYNLMNLPEKAVNYYDSARIKLELRILKNPEDPRLYSAVGLAYAGLGLKEKAIEAGKKAMELMPINKEAFRGVYRVEDLARIYVMTGEYDKAIEQLKLLLSLPGPLSAELLKLDPDWKPLWNLPEFKKIISATPVVK